MNNNKSFRILYFICFICFLLTFAFPTLFISFNTYFALGIGVLSLILYVISDIYLRKNKIKNINVLFPIIFIVFFVLVVIIAFMFNGKVFISFIHFNYYSSFVLFNYLLLSLYTFLSIDRKV